MDAMSAANYPVFILAFFITGSLAAAAALRASPRVKSACGGARSYVSIKPAPSWLPPLLLALIRLWRKRGPSVEGHLGQSGEAFDLCKRETLVLFVPGSNRERIEPSALLISIE
jgi:hypothetical protein